MTNRLAYRLILRVTVLILVLTVFGAGVRTYLDYKEAIGSIGEDFKKIKEGIVPSITVSLWVMDREQLKVQIDGILNFTHFSHAVIESKGRVIVSSGSPKPGRSMRQEFPLYYTYKNEPINLGTLSVSANMDYIYSNIFGRLYERLFRQAVQIFLISLFILFIVRSLIGKRLGSMAAYVRELRPDRLDIPLAPMEERRGDKQDELDQVAAAINSMSAVLRKSFHELDVELNRRKAAEEALEDEKEHLSVTLRSIGDGVISTDTSGTVVIMNKVAEELTGWTNEEVSGKPLSETFHIINEETRQRIEDPVERVLKTGRVIGLANHTVLVSRNGTERVIADSGSPIRDSGGKIIGAVLVFRDITERKMAEETVKRVSRQKELILTAAGEGICGMDSEGKIMFANPAAAEMCGYQVEEMIGAHMHRLLHYARPDGSQYPQKECPHFSTLRIGTSYKMRDEVFWRKDGTSFPVAYTSTPIWERDTIIGAVITYRDITERKRAEESLRKSEEQYRSLFEESKDIVFINTPEGRFIDINRAGVELFGYSSKEELLEADIESDLYVQLGFRKELLRMLDDQGYVKDYELLMRNKKGDVLIVLETASAFRDETGRVTSYRGMLRDITHQRKLEQQLMQAQKMEAVGQLAGGIAHDFNNFLTAIMGYGGILQMEMQEDSALKAYVQHILSSAERASNLTKQLLIFSRKQTIDSKPARINEIIFAIEKLISRIIGEDIEMKLTLSPEDLTIRADIGQMEQVLMNLAANARDAMPEGGMLTIKTESVFMDNEFISTHGYGKEGPYAVLTVSDTGEGMDEKTRERIFEPFFTTKEVGKGTGLGLAMVYGIVTQHNGHINVYSEPGEGTAFRIYLPLIEDKVEDHITLVQPDEIGGTETILICEDDSEVRKMAIGLLTQFGYRVIEAVDGEDAVDKFREHRDIIQLVILDVIMPKKNGKEVYNEVIQMKPGMKAIFASGYPADVIQRKGIIEEGVEFISKPFAPSEFLKTIRKVLQQ